MVLFQPLAVIPSGESRKAEVLEPMARGARAYIMRVWGLSPSGVQGQAPGQEVRGQSPPLEAESTVLF